MSKKIIIIAYVVMLSVVGIAIQSWFKVLDLRGQLAESKENAAQWEGSAKDYQRQLLQSNQALGESQQNFDELTKIAYGMSRQFDRQFNRLVYATGSERSSLHNCMAAMEDATNTLE